MRADIVPGAVSPHDELPDHENVSRRLSDLQGDDPMIPHTLSETRRDWDLSAPGLREAWERGDRSPFHGCDTRPQGT